jgi:chromosome segregation ATPase
MDIVQIIDVIKQIFEMLVIPAAMVGGGVGVYFWRENKALKKAEVKEKEASVTDQQQQTWAHQYEEYQEYIRLLKEDKEELKKAKEEAEAKEHETKKEMEEVRNTLNDVVKRVGVLEIQVERAESFRCERLGCLQRIPPLKGTTAQVAKKTDTKSLKE